MSLLSVFPTWPTVEQALLGSASLLRAINIDRLAATKEGDPVDNTLVSSSRLNESIQVSPIITPSNTGITAIVSIKAKFYYDSSLALRSGFDVFDCIIPFSHQEITDYIDCVPIRGSYQNYPDLPTQVQTLEQFFLYNIYLLGASTYPKTYIDYKTFDVPDLTSKTIPNIFITLSLPFDYQKFCLNHRLIDSLTKLFTTHGGGNSDGGDDSQSSESRITNNFYVTNSTYFTN
jgi:hypothetical protein